MILIVRKSNVNRRYIRTLAKFPSSIESLFQSDILCFSLVPPTKCQFRSQAVTFNYVRNVYFFPLVSFRAVRAFINFAVPLLPSV